MQERAAARRPSSWLALIWLSLPKPHGVCAKCGKTARLLEISADAVVDFFRCDACGDVWVHDRGNSASPPTPITFSNPPNSANPHSQPPTASRREPSRDHATASRKSRPVGIERPQSFVMHSRVLLATAVVSVAVGVFLGGGRDSAFFSAGATGVSMVVALELYYRLRGSR